MEKWDESVVRFRNYLLEETARLADALQPKSSGLDEVLRKISESVARCSPKAQDAFLRMVLFADNFGVFPVNPVVMKGRGPFFTMKR